MTEEIKIKNYCFSFDKECQLKEPDYSNMWFIFRFKDGETAKYRTDKDCHTLQQFLDRMNCFHELEKENKRLQEQLAEANEVIKKYGTWSKWLSFGIVTKRKWLIAYRYLKKWGVK